MPGVTLHDLIEALANSVTEAQDRVERFQISNLRRYFDENDRPIRVEVRVPSLRPGAEPGDEDVIAVPLLAVVGTARLAIKDVEISMDVDIGELTALEDSEKPAPPAGEADKQRSTAAQPLWGALVRRKAVTVDVQSPRGRDRPAMARVSLRVESQEPTEGLARLLLILNQRIGAIGSSGAGKDNDGNPKKS